MVKEKIHDEQSMVGQPLGADDWQMEGGSPLPSVGCVLLTQVCLKITSVLFGMGK